MSKRLLFASVMERFGLARLFELFGAKPGIFVINHHRIGDARASRFDREVFSATVDQLDQQVRYIKQRLPIVGGEELVSLVTSGKPLQRLYVAFTFDDGYLDNYTHAFDVLRANGCGGMFFLVPSYVGTNTIPWWDAIAFFVRNSPKRSLTVDVPEPLTVSLEGDREAAIHRVLQHYKRPDNVAPEAFLAQLEAVAGCDLPRTGRRFLDWNEAAAMQAAGMTIGSHTVTHRILSQLSPEQQKQELTQSRAAIEDKLGVDVTTLAYPVGITSAFTETTEQLAQDAGYNVCFSFYGGVNPAGGIRPTNVLRSSVELDPMLFRTQMTWMSRFGKMPF